MFQRPEKSSLPRARKWSKRARARWNYPERRRKRSFWREYSLLQAVRVVAGPVQWRKGQLTRDRGPRGSPEALQRVQVSNTELLVGLLEYI